MGFIDYSGHPLTKFVYDGIGDFNEGKAAVYRNWQTARAKLINKTGAEISEAPDVSHFSDGLATFVVDYNDNRSFLAELIRPAPLPKMGYYGPNGKIVIKDRFKSAGDFHDGLAPAQTRDRWGYIDHEGRFVIREQFEDACGFSEGLAGVISAGKFGFVDRNGKFVIPAQFDAGHCLGGGPFVFSEGLALVLKNGKFGYIDRHGDFVISPNFDKATPFRRGVAQVRLRKGDSQFDSLIDKAGRCFWNCP